MTREEAIKFAEHAVSMTDIPDVKEFYRMSAAALRPVSREQVEKLRGEWTGNFNAHCSLCDAFNTMAYIGQGGNFCPACGAPMTDEAVDMVMEKINNMEEMTNEH